MNLHEYQYDFISNYLIYSEFIRLFEKMLTAGMSNTAAPLDSRILPHALPDSRTLPHTATHTAALPDTAVYSAANCRTLHEFECRTPHKAYSHTPQLT
jgi:hypothetical protein